MQYSYLLTIAGALLRTSNAAPTRTTEQHAKVDARNPDLIGDLLGGVDTAVSSAIDDGLDELQSLSASTATGKCAKALSILSTVTPVTKPKDIDQAASSLSAVFQASPTPNNLYAALDGLIAAGLTQDNLQGATDFLNGLADGENSMDNSNTRNPSPSVYPKASSSDAPYSLSEWDLRKVVHIPPSFKYGSGAQPVILVPGTGNTGYTTFAGNYIKLLQGQASSVGDPVWLNIPGYQLNDAQVNAEYVAYAINYISGISGHCKVAVAGWSQGNIDTQWAFKYWPSTRSHVTDHVAFSPDYHGTEVANFIDIDEALPPSLLQQEYNSNFISTLRRNGGDSAYVPTTTIYSGFFDEIVEPQQGTGASAYLLSNNGVSASNNEVQTVCAGQLAGSFYTHEGTLYNPLGYALFVDALTHRGPGETSRLDLGSVCSTYLTSGLDLEDFLVTENTLLVAGISIGEYPVSVLQEPAIKLYATY
ncbi:alpha/beta-hydrolase [Teratosphaeria nubilosa]|uniref:Alpha/beta-hydrolase n=1 Tax=Teratosphaeria nubilosa TaxID=161662 RepID=A0A6G1L505_9PEZI|nr:alpha/beta-hydrolase [Teratosphaeria nubilosa]